MTNLVVVVGMGREGRIVEGEGLTVIVGGGRSDTLARRLEHALDQNPAGVISFGLCGGLDPALAAGALLVGSAVIGDAEHLPAHADWAERLMAALPRATRVSFAEGDAMVATTAAKAALHRQTGAAAADMESHIAARLAQRRGLPFAILRAVSDPMHRSLPKAARVGLKADGEPDIPAVLRALLVRPAELPALLRTAREAEVAFRALGDARHLLGPRLACPDVGELGLDVT